MPYNPQEIDIQSITGFPPSIPIRAASYPGLTITTLGALLVIDQSNPPTQISGGMLQGISNTVSTSSPNYTVSTVTKVVASAGNQTILNLNVNRGIATFYNDPASTNLYLKFGATASINSYTVRMAPASYFEMPEPTYSGKIDGIWDGAATGFVMVTELTP